MLGMPAGTIYSHNSRLCRKGGNIGRADWCDLPIDVSFDEKGAPSIDTEGWGRDANFGTKESYYVIEPHEVLMLISMLAPGLPDY